MPEIIFKVCVTCKIEKEISSFNKKSSTKDGLQNVCIDCAAASSRKHYQNNKEKVKLKSKIRNAKMLILAKKIIVSYLKAGCIDCGEKDPVVLDFDHFKDKKYNIANLMKRSGSLLVLEDEIKKCEVRCANCHRRKTAKDFNWWRLYIDA